MSTLLEETQRIVDRFSDYDYSVLSADAKAEIFGLGITAVGPEDIEASSHALYHEMFEAEPAIHSVFVAEGGATVEFDFVGIHKGEVLGVPATGRKVCVPCVAVWEINGGEMTAIRMYVPGNLLLEQIKA